MSRTLSRLLDRAEKALAAPPQRRLHFVWQEEDDTTDTIRMKIHDLIEGGWAREGDQFVTFGWNPPEDEATGN